MLSLPITSHAEFVSRYFKMFNLFKNYKALPNPMNFIAYKTIILKYRFHLLSLSVKLYIFENQISNYMCY